MCVCMVFRWIHSHTYLRALFHKLNPFTVGAAPPLAATTAAELFHFCRVHSQLVQVAYHGG